MALLLGLGKKLAKKATQGALESVAKKAPRMSEALNPHIGKRLYITQADRTALDYDQGLLGGPGFVDLAEIDPAKYKDAAWAVNKQQTASTLVNAMAQNPEEAIWTNLIGSPTQHRSNQIVFDRIMNQFNKAVQEDRLTPELRKTINNRLANMKDDKTGTYFFPKNVDILSPDFAEHAQTFDNRAMIAKILSGEGIKKDMKALYKQPGTIVDTYGDIIRDTSDPLLVDANTHDIGNRLFSLSGNIEEKADLHPAFPFILKGRKESEAFTPAPKEIVLENYVNKYMQENKGKKPGTFSLTRGYPPSVEVDEPLVERLFKSGYAGGGIAKKIAKTLAKDYKPTKGKISELKDYVRDAKGEYGAQRVEKAADLVPNLEKQYDLKSLKDAFDGDNAKSLMVIHPSDFEKYAKPLPDYYGKPIDAIKFENGQQVPTIIQPEHQYSIKIGLDKYGSPTWDSKKMHPEEYLDLLGGIARDKGFDWLPYLMLGKESGGTFRIAGHEGRHRNRALNKLGDEATLINLLPQNIREGLPRKYQEDYQQGLKELLGPRPKVRPEDTYEQETRRMIELPDFFAEGGSVDKDPEQLRNIIKSILGSDIEKDQDFGAGGVVKNIAKKLAKELPEASASGKTPISTTVGTYKKASPILLEDIKDVNAPVLDYGSGMGLGAEELRKTFPNVKTLEPFYKGNFDFTDPSKVPSGEFKGLTNFSVLNTVTPEVRDSIVENIGRVMDRGGVGLITARSPSAVMSTKGRLANEPNSMITQKGTYQKGFDTDELREYIRYILGSDFELEPLKGLSGTSVKVKKKADGGTITTPEIEVKPEYETLKEVPRTGKISGKIADILKPASEFLGQYKVIPQIPLIGGASAAELTGVEGLQTLAEDMSYGYKPIRNLERGKLQTSYFDPRILDAVDLAGTAVGVPILAKNLGKTAFKEGMRQIQTGEGMLGRNVMNPRMNVIKDPGGMVVGGEKAIDEELLNMKKTERPNAPRLTPNIPFREMVNEINQIPKDPNAVALNAWIDTKVKKYIRNQAGSKDDPILKSIESGVEHNFTPPQSGDTKYSIAMKREMVGKPKEGIATTERGKNWEYAVDATFDPVKSKDIKEIINRKMPFNDQADKYRASLLRTEHNLPIYTKEDLEALQLINQIPDENVYSMGSSNLTSRLGLNHVSDVLMEDLQTGRLRPEQLNQMSMEKAIRRTAEYDAQKAKEMTKAHAISSEGMPVSREYDDGYKWIELKHEDVAKTKSALKSEGEMMGHCVGSYCDDVSSGSVKIYSLRSPDGKSHVTIESRPHYTAQQWKEANADLINSDPILVQIEENVARGDIDSKYGDTSITDRDYVRIMELNMLERKIQPIEPEGYVNIKQVKGKQNKRPDEKYQSYVTDFIQNKPFKHEIAEVAEIDNTNLMSVDDVSANGLVPKEIHFHPDVEKAVKKRNAYYGYDKENQSDFRIQDENKYMLFQEAAHDLAKQGKNYFTKDNLLNQIREKYLLPKQKAKGGSINLQQEYKLENMRRRYG